MLLEDGERFTNLHLTAARLRLAGPLVISLLMEFDQTRVMTDQPRPCTPSSIFGKSVHVLRCSVGYAPATPRLGVLLVCKNIAVYKQCIGDQCNASFMS